MIKRLVCLANSRKLNGRCIAGREWLNDRPGAWVRPVSNRPHQEVSEYERQYQDGSDPRLLDIMDVPVIEQCPSTHQTENWLLDPDEYWTKVGEFNGGSLSLLADPPTSGLWCNGHSTYNGLNDYVPATEIQTCHDSLRLIYVPRLQLRVYRPGEGFGNPKRRVQAEFAIAADDYRLWVTDPLIETDFLARPDGVYTYGPAYLTISLGEPLNERYYKLVAAIIGVRP